MEDKLKKDLSTWKMLLANARTKEGEDMALRAIKDIEEKLRNI